MDYNHLYPWFCLVAHVMNDINRAQMNIELSSTTEMKEHQRFNFY